MTRTLRSGHDDSRWATNGAASTTCSKLSSTSSKRRLRSAPARRSATGRSPASRIPSACATVGATRSGSATGASATTAAPSAKSCSSSSAVRRASRVFPTPPGPVSVTRRTSSRRNSVAMAATSRSRPTKLVSAAGRGAANRPRSALRTEGIAWGWLRAAGAGSATGRSSDGDDTRAHHADRTAASQRPPGIAGTSRGHMYGSPDVAPISHGAQAGRKHRHRAPE